MTLQELVDFANYWLGVKTKELLEDPGNDPMPGFAILDAEGAMTFMAIDGNIMNSAQEKRAIANMIRHKIDELRAQATLFCSCCYMGKATSPEAEALMRGLRLDVEQAAAVGLCQMREALIIRVESPLHCFQHTQFYKRRAEKVALEELERGTSHRPARGNFSGFFTQANEAHA